ncbi:MAG: MerR family transcriptional regulator [Rhodoferax sp.]
MSATKPLPPIPPKRYFTIGEVSALCDVKPHVLRYWEQEFSQLKPIKRQGNRRYYQRHEVFLIRRIRELLYDEGFTISGARLKIQGHSTQSPSGVARTDDPDNACPELVHPDPTETDPATVSTACPDGLDWTTLRQELLAIQRVLKVAL